MRSLVAEDDVTSRMILKKFLSLYGECDVAENGEEAVQAAKEAQRNRQSYDLICLDLSMPVMGGQEALREIRKLDAISRTFTPTKIIITTSLNDMKNITDALVGKCNAYLMKPIDPGKLRAELEELGLLK